MLVVKKGGSRMTFSFSWLKNPICFVRLFVATSAIVLALSFFSYRQIRGQLGFASPAIVMASPVTSDTDTVIVKNAGAGEPSSPSFNLVNRNKDHIKTVCCAKTSVPQRANKIVKKKHLSKRLSNKKIIERERALQRAAQHRANLRAQPKAETLESTDEAAAISKHIITHNGQIRYVADASEAGDSKDDKSSLKKVITPREAASKRHVAHGRVVYSGRFSLPIKRSQFWLSSPFGPRRKANGRRGFHQGIDLAAVRGTPVMAAGDGVVVFAGNGGPFGNLVIIEHDDRCRTWYAHLSAIKTHVGAQVSVGKVIGLVGATGYVRKRRGGSGDHLHFGVYIDGRAVNPVHYLT